MSKFFILLVISGFVLLALVCIFEFFPLFANYTAYNYQVTLQIAREEVIENAVLELMYQPSQKQNAISTLEVTLPLFEQEQNTLLQIQNADDAEIVQESIGNYKYVDTAAKILLAEDQQKTDPVQVAIILQHGPGYRTTINQLALVIVSHSEESNWTQFFIKFFLILGLSAVLMGKFLIYRERMVENEKNKMS